MARTKKSQILEPWSAYILEHIPIYPNFASLFYLVDRMQEHPVFSAMYTATSHGLAALVRPGDTSESDADEATASTKSSLESLHETHQSFIATCLTDNTGICSAQ